MHRHTHTQAFLYTKSVYDTRSVQKDGIKYWSLCECVLVVCVYVCNALHNAHEDGKIDVSVYKCWFFGRVIYSNLLN